MLVLSVFGPVGTVSAQTASISQTAQGDTTVAPGETITVEATIDYADMNAPAIDVTLPDGWEVVEHTDDGGTYGPPQPAWLWLEGDDDGVSGSHTVTYTVEVPEDAEPGDYTFAAEGSGKDPGDGSDVSDTDDLTVTVEDDAEPENEPPEAAFDASPAAPEAGEDVTFDASASEDPDGSIESYEWDFDDGDTATGEEVTHAFDDAGEYDVELEVEDDEGETDTTTQTITVSEPPEEGPGAATLLITPDSDTEASTYTGGAFAVENTGDQEISSVTLDLSSAAMPDMVWDPDGTAGDQAAKGLVIDSESGDGVGVVSTEDDDVFSQPHNGVNGSDGYDVLTIEFTDFEPGESMSFSADNDPTSIKDAQIASQEAGPVSGLELARSNVSVEYADGSAQETQLFGDGSEGGAQASATDDVSDAPSIDVEGVDLDEDALREHHSAATVSEADQTVTVTGEPGETVTLLHHEAELELDNVPEYDGTPGYDIEEYEGNKIEQVNYETVTLDSNGEAEVPVTLLDSTDVGGYNYLVAAHGEPVDETGMNSDVVVIEYDEDAEPENEPPEAAFDASPAAPEAGEDVAFDASASDDTDGSIESYEWDFGDGDTATGEEVTHAFDDAGEYDVELTVTDDEGATDTATETIDVSEVPNEDPTAAFEFSPAEPDVDEDVTFDASDSTDADGSIESYEWDFGDGETDTGEEVTHSFDDAGTYTVELEVEDDDGATDTTTQTVTVSEAEPEPMSITEAIASMNDAGDDSVIGTQEIQQAIDFWVEDEPVPNTGGETISTEQMQQLIDVWQEDESVTAADGDT